jgi:hypothetical protein
MSFDEFQLFQKLPPELRIQIWKEACIEPRIVEVVFHTYIHFSVQENETYSIFTTQTPAPAVLHVCPEAREEGLKHYTRIFRIAPIAPDYWRDRVIYINSAKDTVCLTFGHNHARRLIEDDYALVAGLLQERWFNEETVGLIQRIAIEIPVLSHPEWYKLGLILSILPDLREAIMVVGPINIRGRRNARFVDLTTLEESHLLCPKTSCHIEATRRYIASIDTGLEIRLPPLISFKRL